MQGYTPPPLATDEDITNSFEYLMAQPDPTINWNVFQPEPIPPTSLDNAGGPTFQDIWDQLTLIQEDSHDATTSPSYIIPIARPLPIASYANTDFDWVNFTGTTA
jgi:hypothetical protein